MSSTWFESARYGLFVHWGLYALPGGVWHGKPVDYIGEWLMREEYIPRCQRRAESAVNQPI